jgi:ATP/maltotriose-dependent transcriptional regulator MalT
MKVLDFARMLVAGADGDRETMELLAHRFGDGRERSDHWWTMGAVARARAHLLRGEPIQALAEARTVARFATTAVLPSMFRAAIAGVNADALITLGRPGPAIRVLDEVGETPEHAFCQGPRRASAALLLGDARTALAATDECLALGSRHVDRMLPRVLLLRAVAQNRLGMARAADASFVDALAHLLSRQAGFELFEFLSDSLQPLWERVDRSDPLLSRATAHLRRQRPTSVATRPTTQPIPVALSAREIEVISMLRTDATVAEIGQRLYLSSNTIKSHVRSLYRKLGASNRREALDAADTLGIGQTG